MGSLPNASRSVKREVISLIDNQREVAVLKILSGNLRTTLIGADIDLRLLDDADAVANTIDFTKIQNMLS